MFRSPEHKQLFEMVESVMEKKATEEELLEVLVKAANDGYARNAHLGRFSLAKTHEELRNITEDKSLIRKAILKSPFINDPEFDDLSGTMVLF